MKKQMLTAGLITVITLSVLSSANAQKGFYVGAQAAPLLSVKFNGSEVHKAGMDYKAKTSYAFGISGGYGITNNLGIGTELMLSEEKQGYQDNTVSYDEKLSFIKIPVVATFNTNPDASVMFIAKAGPQLGILRSSSISNASNPLMNGSNKDQYYKFHLGAMAAAGIRIKLMGYLYADAGLRLDGAITNIENNKNSGYARRETHTINAGAEAGIKYFFH